MGSEGGGLVLDGGGLVLDGGGLLVVGGGGGTAVGDEFGDGEFDAIS